MKKDKLELDIRESRQGGKILEVEHIKETLVTLGSSKTFPTFSRKMIGSESLARTGLESLPSWICSRLKLKPDRGEIKPGVTTKFGYFRQEFVGLNPDNRLIEEVKEIAEFISMSDGSQVSASKFLDTFFFPPEKQYNYINKLSGGEKKRLQLLKLLVTDPNFLILDEPTNDFDIDTLNVLEDFLEKFAGCLLVGFP